MFALVVVLVVTAATISLSIDLYKAWNSPPTATPVQVRGDDIIGTPEWKNR